MIRYISLSRPAKYVPASTFFPADSKRAFSHTVFIVLRKFRSKFALSVFRERSMELKNSLSERLPSMRHAPQKLLFAARAGKRTAKDTSSTRRIYSAFLRNVKLPQNTISRRRGIKKNALAESVRAAREAKSTAQKRSGWNPVLKNRRRKQNCQARRKRYRAILQ